MIDEISGKSGFFNPGDKTEFSWPAQALAREPFAKVGTYALQFLKIGVSARASGMGSAFTAISNDATATYWNPGGLVNAAVVMTNP